MLITYLIGSFVTLLIFSDDGVVIEIEFVVDQNEALVGDVDGDVAAIALDLVEVVLDFVDLQSRWLLGLILRIGHGRDQKHEDHGGNVHE